MINRVVLVGRLTRDPELKYTTNGIANLRFSIAVNRTFTSQNGERQADFINCVAWRGQAENMAKFLRKGSLIGVEGRIETGSYQAQDGSMRYTTDVVCDSVQFLEPRSASADRGNFGAQPSQDFGRKVCYFTTNKITKIDYKDVDLLKRFVSDRGKILPRRVTGTSAKYQRELTVAIKRARHMALLPFSAE